MYRHLLPFCNEVVSGLRTLFIYAMASLLLLLWALLMPVLNVDFRVFCLRSACTEISTHRNCCCLIIRYCDIHADMLTSGLSALVPECPIGRKRECQSL